jgi:hypothetical protein
MTSLLIFESVNKFRKGFSRTLNISKSDFKNFYSITLTNAVIEVKRVDIKITSNAFEVDMI